MTTETYSGEIVRAARSYDLTGPKRLAIISFRYPADGAVQAVCGRYSAVGRTEMQALRRLRRILNSN